MPLSTVIDLFRSKTCRTKSGKNVVPTKDFPKAPAAGDPTKFAIAMLNDVDIFYCIMDFLNPADIASLAMVSRYFHNALKQRLGQLKDNVEERADLLGRLDAEEKRPHLRVCFACGRRHTWKWDLLTSIRLCIVPREQLRPMRYAWLMHGCPASHKKFTFYGANATFLGAQIQLVMRRRDRGRAYGLRLQDLQGEYLDTVSNWTHYVNAAFDRNNCLILRIGSCVPVSQPQGVLSPAAFRQSIWSPGMRTTLCLCKSTEFVSTVLKDCDDVLHCAEECHRGNMPCRAMRWSSCQSEVACFTAYSTTRQCSTCYTFCRVWVVHLENGEHCCRLIRYYDIGPAFTHSRAIRSLCNDKRLRRCGYTVSDSGYLKYHGPEDVVHRYMRVT